MHLFGLNRRRSETLLLALGQLVLIAYVFQVAAFDHWNADVTNISGVVDSSAHALHADHCHGAPSACADAGGGFAHLSPGEAVQLPAPSPSLVLAAEASVNLPKDAFVSPLPEPPRASA